MNFKFFLLYLFMNYSNSFGQNDVSDEECDFENLLPQIYKATKAIDLTKLDLFPMEKKNAKSTNGFGAQLISIKCLHKRQWLNAFTNKSYILPDEIATVNLEPTGQMIESVTIHQDMDSLKKSLDISGSISIGNDDTGGVSLSGGYKHTQDQLLSNNHTIIDIYAISSAFTVNFRPFSILKTIEGFDEMMSRLPSSYRESPKKYIGFLDSYGTHYFSSVKFGGYLLMRTIVKTTEMSEGNSEAIYGSIALNFKDMFNVDVHGGTEKENSHMLFDEDIRTNYYYFGGKQGIKNGIMNSSDFKNWTDQIQDLPWIYSGKLMPLSYLIHNKTIQKEMHLAIRVKLNKAFLEEAKITLKSIGKVGDDIMKRIEKSFEEIVPDEIEIANIKKELDQKVIEYLHKSKSKDYLGKAQNELISEKHVKEKILNAMSKILK